MPGTRGAPTLGALLDRAGWKLVDIGARGGVLPQLAALAPHAHLFAVEPEPQAAAALRGTLLRLGGWKDVTIIPEAISAATGPRTLYLTRGPGLTSLLRPDPRVVGRFSRSEDWDVIARIVVPVVSLDVAAERYGFADASFLKIDTQGSELEILETGERLLRGSVLGVYVEVEFQRFYEGQPLFADVDQHLRGRGFELFDLDRILARRAGYDPHHFSRRQVLWAHALYLKDPLEVPASVAGADVCARFLALCLLFEHYDLAREFTDRAQRSGAWDRAEATALRREVEHLVRLRSRVLLNPAADALRLLCALRRGRKLLTEPTYSD